MITRWSWSQSANPQLKRLDNKNLLACNQQVLYDDYAACNQFALTDQLDKIMAPALVIGATSDKMTTFELSQDLARNHS